MRFYDSCLPIILAIAACFAPLDRASAQCPLADGLEENDSCAAAVALAVGTTTGLNVSTDDVDYYKVSVAPTDQVVISQTYSSAQAELLLELYADAACTTYVDGAGWGGGSNQVAYGNGGGMTQQFYLRVSVVEGKCGDYDIDVMMQPDPCLVPTLDDALEDNDSCATPTLLTAGAYPGLFVAAQDLDFYAIDVQPGDEVIIVQTYAPGVELYMELYDDPTCSSVIRTDGWGGGSNSLSWANVSAAPTTIYLACRIDDVFASCTIYDLAISIGLDSCQDPAGDDLLEDNDACGTAAHVITSQNYTGLFVSKLDSDVYSFQLAPGGYAVISVDHIQDNGDIDIALYDDTPGACLDGASFVTASQTFADSEVVSHNNSTGATVTYYLHVQMWVGSGHGCNNYDMSVMLVGDQVATPTCAGDGTFDAGGGLVACPCGNESAVGAEVGCLNSAGRGAALSATGSNFFADDNLVLNVTQARPNQPGILIQGESLTALPFKDGILCMGVPTERIEVVQLDASGAASTSTSIVTRGAVPGPGALRYYQVWYRDPVISVCGTGSNLSGALRVDWI
jgi:hypothetical protein